MIDIHCHYLPDVDDGAKTDSEALELVRLSVQSGIHTIVLTPHVYPGRWNNTQANLAHRFDAFRQLVSNEGIHVQLHLGGEVHLLPESLQLAVERGLPFIGRQGNKDVLLLELPDSHVPAGTDRAVTYLIEHNIVPIIAHPERNKGVMRDIAQLKSLVSMGCLTQLTAASVIGRFGENAFNCASEILDAGLCTVIATDAHNAKHRPPLLAQAKDAIESRFGVESADLLTMLNPLSLLTDVEVEQML